MCFAHITTYPTEDIDVNLSVITNSSKDIKNIIGYSIIQNHLLVLVP